MLYQIIERNADLIEPLEQGVLIREELISHELKENLIGLRFSTRENNESPERAQKTVDMIRDYSFGFVNYTR
jgi:hypothetical protein